MQLITPAGYHRQLIQAGEYLRYFNFMFTAEILTEEMRAALSSGEAPLFTILCQAEFEYVLALSQRLLLSQGNASSTVRIFVKRGNNLYSKKLSFTSYTCCHGNGRRFFSGIFFSAFSQVHGHFFFPVLVSVSIKYCMPVSKMQQSVRKGNC